MISLPAIHFQPHTHSDGRVCYTTDCEFRPSSDRQAYDKAFKKEANYRKADGFERCGTCIHFEQGPNDRAGTCAVVRGIVRSNYVSDLYEQA